VKFQRSASFAATSASIIAVLRSVVSSMIRVQTRIMSAT